MRFIKENIPWEHFSICPCEQQVVFDRAVYSDLYFLFFFVDLLKECEIVFLRILKIVVLITQCILIIYIMYRRIVHNYLPQRNQPIPARIQLNPSRLQQQQLNPSHVHPNSSCIQPDHLYQSNPSHVHPNLPPQNQQKPLCRSTRRRSSPSRLNL